MLLRAASPERKLLFVNFIIRDRASLQMCAWFVFMFCSCTVNALCTHAKSFMKLGVIFLLKHFMCIICIVLCVVYCLTHRKSVQRSKDIFFYIHAWELFLRSSTKSGIVRRVVGTTASEIAILIYVSRPKGTYMPIWLSVTQIAEINITINCLLFYYYSAKMAN